MKKLRNAFLMLITTVLLATLSYHLIEGMSWFDSIYMTLITISTVGYEEVIPLSYLGRVITILLIIVGISLGGYTIGMFIRMLVEGELRKTFGRRKVEKIISKMNGHFIICGYGRIGSLIVKELLAHGKEVVVIENDSEAVELLEENRILYYPLDATMDDSLIKAGIDRASAIVTAVKSDSDNVFITLTARGLKPDIFILARASEEKNEVKLKRAGATRVVSPYLIGGTRMAHVLIRPTVIDFIDIAVMENNLGLHMEEVKISSQSNLIGKNLIQSNLRQDFGVIIVLIKKNSGDMLFNPTPTVILEENDVLVILGKKEEMDRMGEVL